ncbi:MAG: TPM domain-containing protein [Pseudorhodoplanes sp.]|nr:hypothetical protein [Pseudorhodoplanes sp.]MBW7950436.1 TPM domain-containing protein [Pseudorhodoplanes sp.]MCQ3943061.1 hypothetical protein [Alphaproteobacteria bacterium]
MALRVRLLAFVLAFCALAVGAQAQGLSFPPLSGRVVDEAGLLDAAARESLTLTLADLEAKSTDQLVVVTLRSLRGTSIEDYGYQLGRAWQIGQKDKNNGVLLIVAPNERKVRIEVGYGLEGTLTDAITKFIIENSILPRFKAGDFPGGIRRGVEDIVQVLTGDAEEYKQRAQQAATQRVSQGDLIVMAFFILIVFLIIANIVLGIVRSIRQALMRAGVIERDPKGKRHWLDTIPIIVTSGSSSGGSSWSGGSSGGGFSGGGGSFGGGGSSGSW